MSMASSATHLADLRARGGIVDSAELSTIWADLPTIRPDELRGAWRGGLFDTGHPFNRRPPGRVWYGKYFASSDDARPDILVDDDGSLFAAGSGGSLWMVEFRGEVTAALIYDDQPVLDHFKRVDENSVLGVMDRRVDRETATWLYFWLDVDHSAPSIRGTDEGRSAGPIAYLGEDRS